MQVRANGIDVHYAAEGSGPWLVMSHALGCDHGMWDAQAAWLTQRFTVLRFDTRGHGRNSCVAGQNVPGAGRGVGARAALSRHRDRLVSEVVGR